TSVLTRLTASARCCRQRARSSGTDPSGCSSLSSSARAPAPLPRRSPAARHSLSPAAAIRWRPSRSTVSRTVSPTSRPAVERFSSSSKARLCRPSRCWKSERVDDISMTRSPGGTRVAGGTTMLRRTKIVATVGPATDDLGVLTEMMRAGLDVVRLNASHGTVEDRRRRLSLVREAAHRADKCIGVLLDLGGPKIRIECFREGRVTLKEGQAFTLDTTLDPKGGSADAAGVAYQYLHA